MRVLWTKPAQQAYERLPQGIKEEIAHRVGLILDFPEMYPVRKHQPFAGFRYFFTKGWIVSYTAAEDSVVILAVFHGGRGLDEDS